MAWFEVDIFEKCVAVDLHKYSRRTALIVAREKIIEAYGHGFRHVRRLWMGNGKKYLLRNIELMLIFSLC